MDELNSDKDSEINSLEDPTTVVESAKNADNNSGRPAPEIVDASSPDSTNGSPSVTPPPPHKSWIRRFLERFNIYLLLFLLLLVLAGAAGAIFYLKANENTPTNNPASQTLSQNALDQLANNDVTVGEPQHTLSVQSNAVFTGSVLIRSNLQIAGTLQVGSNLAINGIRVTGNSTFDDVQITKSLALTGNGSIQGQLNVSQGLNVDGTGTFQGAISAPQLTVGSLQLSGNLNITHHITAGGSTPTRTYGTALGSGGTASISGADTAGSVTINTGGNPGPGCFVTINFATAFNSTPHVVITPVGSGAAGLAYYVNRSTTSFSICATNSAPGGTTFGFDYIAFD